MTRHQDVEQGFELHESAEPHDRGTTRHCCAALRIGHPFRYVADLTACALSLDHDDVADIPAPPNAKGFTAQWVPRVVHRYAP